MVGEEKRLAVVAEPDLVGIDLARELRRGKAVADLDALHRIDRHKRASEFRIEFAIDGRPEACRRALGNHLDYRAHRRAPLADAVEIILEESYFPRVRAEEGIAADLVPVPALPVDLVRSDLHQSGADRHIREHFSRDRPCRNAACGLAG